MGKRQLLNLVDISPPRDQARLWEQQSGLGTAFMAVTPHPALQTTIASDTYRLGLKWWLGLPIMQAPPGKPFLCPGCSAQLDVFGDHLVCCRRTNFARQHCGVQQALAQCLSEAGQGHALEVGLPEGCADQSLRPADILLHSWTKGQDTAVDITVAHGWQ